MQPLEAYYITGDPDGGPERAIGPDEPSSEGFILVGLTYQECASYVLDHGMLGWAKIVPVTLTPTFPANPSEFQLSLLPVKDLFDTKIGGTDADDDEDWRARQEIVPAPESS